MAGSQQVPSSNNQTGARASVSLTSLMNIITVSGAGTTTCNGDYVGGTGADAMLNGAPKWVKSNGSYIYNTGTPGSTVWWRIYDFTLDKNVYETDEYAVNADGTFMMPWEVPWILQNGSNPVPDVIIGGSPLMGTSIRVGVDPQTGEGTDAGTAAANGLYLFAGYYKPGGSPISYPFPWYAKIGGTNSGDPETSDSIYAIDYNDPLNAIWEIRSVSSGLYYGTGVGVYPYQDNYSPDSGSAPSPTVTRALDTAQSVIDGKVDTASMPKKYKWLGDGGAATGTIIANTLGVTINVTNPGTGAYRFIAASGSPFTIGKTTAVPVVIDDAAYLSTKVTVISDTQIDIEIFDTSTQTAADPDQYQLIVEVEP